MRILLAVPYQDIEPYILPNLGFGYLASALRKNGQDVYYVDCLKEKVCSSNWGKLLTDGLYDVVGIQMYSYAYNSVREMFQIAKKVIPHIFTVVGGPHANAVPKETLENNPEIDYLIYGEGERAFPQLINLLQSHVTDEKMFLIPNLA